MVNYPDELDYAENSVERRNAERATKAIERAVCKLEKLADAVGLGGDYDYFTSAHYEGCRVWGHPREGTDAQPLPALEDGLPALMDIHGKSYTVTVKEWDIARRASGYKG